MNYSESRSIEEICENSSKLITLIDLAGHHKYMKTTIFGLTCYSPDFTMLVVSANTGMGEYKFPLVICYVPKLKGVWSILFWNCALWHQCDCTKYLKNQLFGSAVAQWYSA